MVLKSRYICRAKSVFRPARLTSACLGVSLSFVLGERSAVESVILGGQPMRLGRCHNTFHVARTRSARCFIGGDVDQGICRVAVIEPHSCNHLAIKPSRHTFVVIQASLVSRGNLPKHAVNHSALRRDNRGHTVRVDEKPVSRQRGCPDNDRVGAARRHLLHVHVRAVGEVIHDRMIVVGLLAAKDSPCQQCES